MASQLKFLFKNLKYELCRIMASQLKFLFKNLNCVANRLQILNLFSIFSICSEFYASMSIYCSCSIFYNQFCSHINTFATMCFFSRSFHCETLRVEVIVSKYDIFKYICYFICRYMTSAKITRSFQEFLLPIIADSPIALILYCWSKPIKNK